jgi:hypothetical protein
MMLGFRTIYGLGVAVSLNSHLTEIIPSSNGTWNWDMIGIYFPVQIIPGCYQLSYTYWTLLGFFILLSKKFIGAGRGNT